MKDKKKKNLTRCDVELIYSTLFPCLENEMISVQDDVLRDP
jgi:hypothetical protein